MISLKQKPDEDYERISLSIGKRRVEQQGRMTQSRLRVRTRQVEEQGRMTQSKLWVRTRQAEEQGRMMHDPVKAVGQNKTS